MKSGCITDTSRIFSGGVQHLDVTFILCSEKKTKAEEKSLDEKIIGRARSAWKIFGNQTGFGSDTADNLHISSKTPSLFSRMHFY